jgi:hypothetical protein
MRIILWLLGRAERRRERQRIYIIACLAREGMLTDEGLRFLEFVITRHEERL